MKLNELKELGLAPEWLNEVSLKTLQGGYLQLGETPLDAYKRCANFSASVYEDSKKFELDFLEAIWKNWLCPSTPVLANANTTNLQISCYSGTTDDSLLGIMDHLKELATLTKFGGGCGSSFSQLRPSGSSISGGGESSGIIPFLKMVDSVVDGVKQGRTRRGAVASYLDFTHGDVDDFMSIRNSTGDLSRKIQSEAFHNALVIDDISMEAIVSGDKILRNRWNEMMKYRVETGEPFVMFKDNANKNCPEEYSGLITHSNLCTEIFSPITVEETFVCCLSSLNLARWDEWKDYIFPNTKMNLIQLSVYFLDAVITNFIKQTLNVDGLQRARRFAERHRMLGLGVLGWHTLLQSKELPFESFGAMTLNNHIFSTIRNEAYKASYDLGKLLGNCEVNGKRRNTALLAIAPTMSNSLLSGGVSQGIEPITANLFSQKSAKGIFIRVNPVLEKFLEERGLNTSEIWNQIDMDKGSVKNIKQLSPEEKRLFLTAREISQFALVQQAAQRQKYLDQGQSLNLFFSLPTSPEDSVAVAKYINNVHLTAWELGVKSLYYLKTDSPLKGDIISIDEENGECLSCHG